MRKNQWKALVGGLTVSIILTVVVGVCATQTPTQSSPVEKSVDSPTLTPEQTLRAENIRLKIQLLEAQKNTATCQQQMLAVPAKTLEAEILKNTNGKFNFNWDTLSVVPADTAKK